MSFRQKRASWRIGPASLLIAAMLTSATAPALAANAAAKRGERVVEEWCRGCHVHDGELPGADMAPPFAAIVAVPGRDRDWFEDFLEADHFPMTTFRLFEHEKADVVEWLLDLQRRQP